MTSVAATADNRRAELGSSSRWILFSLAPLFLGGSWVAFGSSTGNLISSLSGYVVAQLLLVATTTDLLNRKIPNWATYPAFVWGLAINVVGHFAPNQSDWLGAVGLTQSIAGGFGILMIMFVIFSISGGGAGDVKLSACLGALLGWDIALDAMLYSFVVAGAGMLCYSIWVDGPLFIINSLGRAVLHWLLPTIVAPPQPQQSALLKKKFPLAPFFACGTCLGLYLT